MTEKQSQEELPGAKKYEDESVYQRNPASGATEFKGEIPRIEEETPEQIEWEEEEQAADKQ